MAGLEPSAASHYKKRTIVGVDVLLPVDPYKSQVVMMSQIIRGLKTRQNCLLESPTGTGKSLALLCSTLAWQRQQTASARRYNRLVDQGINDPVVLARAAGLPLPPQATPGAAQAFSSPERRPLAASSTLPPTPGRRPPTATGTFPSTPTSASTDLPSAGGFFFDDDDDFKSQEPTFRGREANHGLSASQASYVPPEASAEDFMDLDDSFFAMDYNVPERPKKLKVPKIFIGTRTHKQVEQIVRELNRTAYRDINMVVLSSREHTCIHPVVKQCNNKNERCTELFDPIVGESCSYYHGVSKIKTHDQLAQCGGLQGAWDIEDLVRMGHKLHACPYFTARGLVTTAELIICPYNYLVDPIIRESMDISLRNHILILDEAHNIEDAAREAASCTIAQDEILESIDHLQQRKINKEACDELSMLLSTLLGWIDENKDSLKPSNEYGRSERIFTGTEIIAHFDRLEIGRSNYSHLRECFTSLTEDRNPETEEPRLHPSAKKILRDFFLICHFLFVDDMKFKDDYRVALIRNQERKKPTKSLDGWFSARSSITEEYIINFWCLNPAVAFSPISNVTHSIILTSGTLAPLKSFQSELGVPFNIRLEADHVIDHKQVFVGTIGHGPLGGLLEATYKNVDTWQFQDELGELILSVCSIVPGGVLCFLPSYAMLNKLVQRWQNTEVWNQISEIKEAMTEPKSGTEFERHMTLFYAANQNALMEPDNPITGAFLLAVHRGKVSEGVDLSDNNARAVIAVGIPFPNTKDLLINLKKQYNNQHIRSRQLLAGRDWYEIQAYRAINQALGRCIRHRYDWGALILVDNRFQRDSIVSGKVENAYTVSLPKWVRYKLVHHIDSKAFMKMLGAFVQSMLTNPPTPPRPCKVSPPASPEPAQEAMSHSAELDKSNNTDMDVTESVQALVPNGSNASEASVDPRQSSSTSQSSKKSLDIAVQSSKGQTTVREEPELNDSDLDDFDLTHSPSLSYERVPVIPMRRRVLQKKPRLFITHD